MLRGLVLSLLLGGGIGLVYGLIMVQFFHVPWPVWMYALVGAGVTSGVWMLMYKPWRQLPAVLASFGLGAKKMSVGLGSVGLPILGDLKSAHAIALVIDELTGTVYGLALTHYVGNLYAARVTFPGGGVKHFLIVLADGHKLGYYWGVNLPVYVVEGKSILPHLFVGKSIELESVEGSIVSMLLGNTHAFLGVKLGSESQYSRPLHEVGSTSDPEVIAETLLRLTEDLSGNIGGLKLVEITPNIVVGISREATKQIVRGALRAIKQRTFDSLVMVNELLKQGDRFERIAETATRAQERLQWATGTKIFLILFGIAIVLAVVISAFTPGGLAGAIAGPFVQALSSGTPHKTTTPPKHVTAKPAAPSPPTPPPANQTGVVKVGENATIVERPMKPPVKK
jgi:hypothetical protein